MKNSIFALVLSTLSATSAFAMPGMGQCEFIHRTPGQNTTNQMLMTVSSGLSYDVCVSALTKNCEDVCLWKFDDKDVKNTDCKLISNMCDGK